MSSPFPIQVARVLYLRDGRFEPNRIGDFAYALPIIIDNSIIDIVAWAPSTGQIATRLGDGACLGEGQIGIDGVGSTGLPLPVWRHPLGWLIAERTGIVIADYKLASHVLAGLHLLAENDAHTAELQNTLKVPSPTIISARSLRAETA